MADLLSSPKISLAFSSAFVTIFFLSMFTAPPSQQISSFHSLLLVFMSPSSFSPAWIWFTKSRIQIISQSSVNINHSSLLWCTSPPWALLPAVWFSLQRCHLASVAAHASLTWIPIGTKIKSQSLTKYNWSLPSLTARPSTSPLLMPGHADPSPTSQIRVFMCYIHLYQAFALLFLLHGKVDYPG